MPRAHRSSAAPRSVLWLTLSMVAAGAGLLAFALIDLVGLVRGQDEAARRDAARHAEQVAARLRTLLDDPELLQVLPEWMRFARREGTVVVPRQIGWLDQPPAPPSEAALPVAAWALLHRARRAEWVTHDVAEAERLSAEALGGGGLGAPGRAQLVLDAAWRAARRGARREALARVASIAGDAELHPVFAASALRLLGSHSPVDTKNLWERALLLPHRERVRLLGDRPEGAAIDLQRHTLRIAARQRDELRHGRLLRDAAPDGDQLVLLHGDRSAQRGALVPLASLFAWLRAGPGAASPVAGQLVGWDPVWTEAVRPCDPSSGEDVARVTDALGVVPRVQPPTLWTHPVVLAALLAALVVCFGAGLLLSLRAWWRESAAVRARAEFLTSVTHELKTPLASIRLLADMLEEGRVQGTAKVRDYYRMLANESSRLTVLIENVLDLGRMERGERAYDVREHDLDQVVREALEVFDPVAVRAGLSLSVELAGRGVGAVDRGALVQALLNVLDNARKYAGGRIAVHSRIAGATWSLVVRDHGPGIPAADREAIFARFFRSAAAQGGAVPGVGLGLYLARAILRVHGGDLVCRAPVEGTGTEFAFTLPVRAPAPPTPGERTWESAC
ncbi:MAG: HAMP domain-containing histidine kinase [Planctomycetes bacterium]|nr:HAMP domain-containing histidine kinase [Planctomycetota bacterium]MCB9872206.1 HAMP domain-containing histidine kinase [Planctomycetota bacterium]